MVGEPAAITVANDGSETDVTCNGTSTGSITLGTVSGGNGTYIISWTGPGGYTGSGVTITGLAAGTYNYSVTDGNNCAAAIGSVVVGELGLLTGDVSATDVSCNGLDDGTITINSPTGGSGTYEYSINGGMDWQPGGSFMSLMPDTYNVQIRDAQHTACVIPLYSDLQIIQPDAIILTATSTDVTCKDAANGTITASATGGISGTPSITVNDLPYNPNATYGPGTYTVKATDYNSSFDGECIETKIIIITEPDVLSATVASTQPTCNGTDDGSITISNPVGGYGNYDYSIDGGATWAAGLTNTGLAPGTYDVRIRDAAFIACVIDLGNQVITYPVTLSATVTNTQPTCNGTDDGTITISNPAGGYGTYEYSIDGGATWTAGLTNPGLAPGTYDVPIRDAAFIACVIDLGNQVIHYPVTLSATVNQHTTDL